MDEKKFVIGPSDYLSEKTHRWRPDGGRYVSSAGAGGYDYEGVKCRENRSGAGSRGVSLCAKSRVALKGDSCPSGQWIIFPAGVDGQVPGTFGVAHLVDFEMPSELRVPTLEVGEKILGAVNGAEMIRECVQRCDAPAFTTRKRRPGLRGACWRIEDMVTDCLFHEFRTEQRAESFLEFFVFEFTEDFLEETEDEEFVSLRGFKAA